MTITAPMCRSSTNLHVFSFLAWVIVGMIWTFCSSFIVVLYPLWESRVAITQIATGIVKVGVPHCRVHVSVLLNLTLFCVYRTYFHLEVESLWAI